MGATGSQAGLSFTKETVWGETPSAQFAGINFVSESMEYKIENKTSKTIRPDRQTSDLVQVGAECSGGFSSEFQSGNVDGFLPGFFMDTDWHVESDALTGVDFAIETGAGVGGIITTASAPNATVGEVITITGAAQAGNNVRTRVISISGNDIHVTAPLVTETSASITMASTYIRNGVTKSSYSIERENSDVSQFFLYKGMTPDSMEFALEVDEPAMINLDFVGRFETLEQTTASTGNPTDPALTPVINSADSVGFIKIDNVPVEACIVEKANIKLGNQVEGKKAVGTLGFCNSNAKSLLLTGDLEMFFEDNTYYDRYLAGTEFSLEIEMSDTAGNTYTIFLPRCKFDTGKANVSGKDDDVMESHSFVGLVHGDSGFTIQITK